MDRQEVFERIRSTLVSNFEIAPEKVTLQATLTNDLELDSIDAIDMAVHLQEITNVRVEEADLRKLRTVGDTVELVMQLLARTP